MSGNVALQDESKPLKAGEEVPPLHPLCVLTESDKNLRQMLLEQHSYETQMFVSYEITDEPVPVFVCILHWRHGYKHVSLRLNGLLWSPTTTGNDQILKPIALTDSSLICIIPFTEYRLEFCQRVSKSQ